MTPLRYSLTLQRHAGHENNTDMPMESQKHFDILIIGAGISRIDAAYHLQTAFPIKTYSILEAREAIRGTGDLFRYDFLYGPPWGFTNRFQGPHRIRRIRTRCLQTNQGRRISRNLYRSILPVAVFGSSDKNSMRRGYL
jgi:glycine/D-amino acid oxidase-like deaminating enzyme